MTETDNGRTPCSRVTARDAYDRAMATESGTIITPDGRTLEYLVIGPAHGPALVFHPGTPGAATELSGLMGPATALGLRTITYARPGYGLSTERVGRRVADAAQDVGALLDELGVAEFLSLGWSGGGPHVLACAALMPGRCRAATSLASVAPYGARNLDFLAGMEPDNVEEFEAAIAGFDQIDALLSPLLDDFRQTTAASVADELAGLLSSVDRAALTGEFAEELAASFRRAVQTGIGGWRDDDLAFARDWGFAVAEITAPVAVWQGRQDRFVPFAHGEWLAAELPNGTAHLLEDDGHLSLIARVDEILADLLRIGTTGIG
jgi:pimeloyl-ACP methyl ester carboxylesterase